MRAFATKYHLEEKYVNAQKALLEALLRVETRPGRRWLTNEKIVMADAYTFYREIMESASDENRNDGKWVVYKCKQANRSVRS